MKNRMMKFAMMAIMDEINDADLNMTYEEFIEFNNVTFNYYEVQNSYFMSQVDAFLDVHYEGELIYHFRFALAR